MNISGNMNNVLDSRSVPKEVQNILSSRYLESLTKEPKKAPSTCMSQESRKPSQVLFLFPIYLFIYLFIYFWLHWVFIAVRGLSLVVVSRGHSSLQCVGFSLWWLLLLWSTGPKHLGFSSCGMWAQ